MKQFMLRVQLSLFALIVWLGFASLSYAQSNETDKPNMLAGVGELVDETHNRISGRFSKFVVQIDDFLGSGERQSELNNSWTRIRLDTIKPGAEPAKLAAKIKLRLVLPQAQKRYRLLLSTGDDDSSAANTDAAQRERTARAGDDSIALALRFVRTARESSSLNFDLGASYKDDEAQVFGRINMAYKRDWIWGFENRISNSFKYFSYSGYDNRFRYDLTRPFSNRKNVYFRNSTEFVWRKNYKGVGIGETLGIYADLGPKMAIALEGITGYTTALNYEATDRFQGGEVRVRFRHSIWRDWFFYEIWPSVSWSASNDYEQAYGGLFRIEITLGQQ